MRFISIFVVVAGTLASQSVGPAVNVLFPSNNNFSPTTQEILVSADGSWVAVTGSLPAVGDVVITDLNEIGSPTTVTSLVFPGGNDVHATNNTLVASRQGHFLCCYGSSGTLGDLVFIARNAGGAWVATNVLFPSSNNVPVLGTKPVISDDEQFIVCRGLAATADVVIVPVTFAAGVYSPGAAFNEVVPGGNTVPLQAINPVVAPNSLSFAIAGNSGAIGDLIVATVGRPVSAANTTLANVLFPSGNNLISFTVPPLASPMSNYYAVHGSDLNTGDLVVVAMGVTGAVGTVTNVLWSSNNTANTAVPPAVSGDGRLIAVDGSAALTGDVILLPIDAAGAPGSPANVLFPGSNSVSSTVPPVISSDARLVVQRGSDGTIGDLVAMQVTFTTPTTISGFVQNILYPAGNNFPAAGAHIALAPDRSYAVTLGNTTIGDIVITPFDATGVGQTPINLLYALGNNVTFLGGTPRISREGLLIMTPGDPLSGEAVITGVGLNQATGLIEHKFTVSVVYPASNNNDPTTRDPTFSPTTQFAVAAGSPTIGDLVFIPLLDPFPRFLGRADVGTVVPVRFLSPPDAGKVVAGAAAFGRHPGIALPPPDGRVIPLNNDALLVLSINPNPVFLGFVGVLDANGVYDAATIVIPPLVSLEGVFLYLAFVIVDPGASFGIGTVSRPAVFVVE